ncbi:MAG: DUF2267 domain-containing protein [Phenylobacterium sp.]|jgi:uncharacterized protein (DUF2267 family)|uniref:DUF2267 domain-containing protein n=1 Tax=Phenylobacterium sp. TaxID=1871053 RepID=UPI003919EA4A
MSAGLAVFDTTVQQSNEWLKLVEARLKPCDRQQAYGALRAVLHVLRDRLPPEAVLGLSAQLPMLLRGLYLEGWRSADGPSDLRSLQDFADAVAERLPPAFPRQPNEAAEAVFAALAARLDPGEVRKIIEHLPTPLRRAWPTEHQVA